MGWEAALAVDVEHMPLMIHTVCGRSAAAAELVASTSVQNWTVSFFLQCYILFFSTPPMETLSELNFAVYALASFFFKKKTILLALLSPSSSDALAPIVFHWSHL